MGKRKGKQAKLEARRREHARKVAELAAKLAGTWVAPAPPLHIEPMPDDGARRHMRSILAG